jgi:hypothetical protein
MLRVLFTILLSAMCLSAADASGKWSGSFTPTADSDTRPLYIILQQDHNTLAGSGGPDESKQHPFKDGKVDGDRLKFEVPAGDGVFVFDLLMKDDEISGDLQFKREGETRTAKVSLKRVAS